MIAGGTIGGIEYLDVTGNGLTADDTPMSRRASLSRSQQQRRVEHGRARRPRRLTDGTYAFTGLAAGTYKVRQVTPTGYVRTAPAVADFYSVTLASGQTSSGNNFANAALGDKSVLERTSCT